MQGIIAVVLSFYSSLCLFVCFSVCSFIRLSPVKFVKSFTRWQHLVAASGGKLLVTALSQ